MKQTLINALAVWGVICTLCLVGMIVFAFHSRLIPAYKHDAAFRAYLWTRYPRIKKLHNWWKGAEKTAHGLLLLIIALGLAFVALIITSPVG